MKLKTLNDMGTAIDKIQKVIQVAELKAEAIKWVKAMKLMELREDTTESHSNRDCAYWIKHFFNITEEDLK